jgi:hypothetical protein
MLSLSESPYGWRGTGSGAHRVQAQTRDLVERHWHLVEAPAGENYRHQEFDQAQIKGALGRRPRDV